MAYIFFQDNFLGGLNTRLEASKLPVGQYPLLFNGRIQANTVKPVKRHLKLDIPAGTKRQGLYAVGKLLVLFTDGLAYWKDTEDLSSPWSLVRDPSSGLYWTALSATVDRIYAEAIPVSYFQGSIDYQTSEDPADVVVTFPDVAAPTESWLFVTDGVNQPRVIAADQTWRDTKTYAEWLVTDPEYVPICVLPRKSGGKLYVVDAANRNKIYHSVTGRFLDFGIVRDEEGLISGTADDIAKAVDYNPITSLLSISDPGFSSGGLFVGTLFSSYVIIPDYTTTIFAEPQLPDRSLFPTGPVNDRSFADLNGDTAFITQTGIQSFNVTEQFRAESNNFPLGEPIAKLLVNPQSNTAAVNYDIFALFSVNTIFGKMVLVYDNIYKTFVSIDSEFGEVTDFAVTKYEGVQKLYFLTADGDVYQAYGSDEYATCRLYLGDYATYDPSTGSQIPGKQHIVEKVRLQFTEVKADTTVQLSVFVDKALTQVLYQELAAINYPENIPYPLPFAAFRQTLPADFTVTERTRGWKTGFLLEWDSGAELLGISCEGDVQDPTGLNITGTYPNPLTVVTLFNDNAFGSELSPMSGSWDLVTGLTKGTWYSVVGSCHTGDKVITDGIFRANNTEVNVNGSLRACGNVKTVWDLMAAEKPDLIVGLGDHAMSSGTEDEVTRILSVVDISKVEWLPGNHDQMTLAGKWFFAAKPSTRYRKVTIGNIDFFFLNSDVSEPDGISETSTQADWLKLALEESTNTFKVVCLHHPPYTDVSTYSPGYTTLRWPFKSWGADLVLSGHSHVYERFVVNGLQYIVNGPSGSAVRSFKVGENNSVARSSSSGYLRLTADKFKLLGEFIDNESTIIDAFSIYA